MVEISRYTTDFHHNNSKMSPGNEIELTLIGDGPERAKLEAIVNKNQLNNVRFLGSQNNLKYLDC